MIKAPYNKERDYDENLSKVLSLIKRSTIEKNDDFLILLCGNTGSGKSSLMMHMMDEYLGEESSADYIGLDRSEFAEALKLSSEKDLPRFVANDEGNVSKRDSLTKYNKDIIDIYQSVRGLKMLHAWCTPSLDMVDKFFIEERIKAVIFCANKDVDRPRLYYFILKRDLLKIWNKYGNLKLDLLRKVCKEYAYYRGWFKAYKGKLLEEYDPKKEKRMKQKINEFYEQYGNKDELEGLSTRKQVSKKLGLGDRTIREYQKQCFKNEVLEEDVDVIRRGSKWYYTEKAIEQFDRMKVYKRERMDSGGSIE